MSLTKKQRWLLAILVSGLSLAHGLMAMEGEPAKTEQQAATEQADALFQKWEYRYAEVLTKRDVNSERREVFNALAPIVDELRDNKAHLAEDIEGLRQSKSDWQSYKSAVDSDNSDLEKIYKKSLSY